MPYNYVTINEAIESNGEFDLLDPSYDRDTLQEGVIARTIYDILPGKFYPVLKRIDRLVDTLYLHHETIDSKKIESLHYVFLGKFGVDTAKVLIGNWGEIEGCNCAEYYEDITENVGKSDGAIIYNKCLVCSTGMGDGSYDIHYSRNKSGDKIAVLRLTFCSEYDRDYLLRRKGFLPYIRSLLLKIKGED